MDACRKYVPGCSNLLLNALLGWGCQHRCDRKRIFDVALVFFGSLYMSYSFMVISRNAFGMLSCSVVSKVWSTACSVLFLDATVYVFSVPRCWLNGSIRPVLKHGPRSLTYARVFGCVKPVCVMKVTVGIFAPTTDHDLLREVWVRAQWLGPERWWTMRE